MNLSQAKLSNSSECIYKAHDANTKTDTSLAIDSANPTTNNQNLDSIISDLEMINILIDNNSSIFNIDPQFDNFTHDYNSLKDDLII